MELRWVWHLYNLPCASALLWLISIARYGLLLRDKIWCLLWTCCLLAFYIVTPGPAVIRTDCKSVLSMSTYGRRKRRLLRSEKSATFPPKFKKVKKDSLKLSSKIRLIVKSLRWIWMYFLPQFQNNYQKIRPNCTFIMHYDLLTVLCVVYAIVRLG